MKRIRLYSWFKMHKHVSSRALAMLCALAFSLSALNAQVTQPWPTYFMTAGHCNGVRSFDLSLPNPLPAGQHFYIRMAVWNSGVSVSNSFVVERLVGGNWEAVTGVDPAYPLQTYLNDFTNYQDAHISPAAEWELLKGDNNTFALDVTAMLTPGVQYRVRNKSNVFHLGTALGTPPTVPTNFTYGSQNDIVPAGNKLTLQYLTPDGNWSPVPMVGGKPTITICKKGKLKLSASDVPGDQNDFFNYEWKQSSKFEAPNNVGTVTIHDLTVPQSFTVQRKGVCAEIIKEDFQVNVVPKIEPIIDVAGLAGSLCGNNTKTVVIKELNGATELSWGVKEDGHGIYNDQVGNAALTLPAPPAPQEFTLPNAIAFNYASHDPTHVANGEAVEHEMRVVASNGECAGVKLLKVKVYPGVIKPNVVTTVGSASLCSPLNITYKDLNQALQPKGTIYAWEMGTPPVFSPISSGASTPTVSAVNNTPIPQQFHSVVTVSDKSGTCKQSSATYPIPALGIAAADYAHVMVNPGVLPQFLIIREKLPATVPPTMADYCTPQKLRIEDKTPFSKWREWKLVEPAQGALTQNVITWGPPLPATLTGTNPDFFEVNPFSVTEKRKRFIEMRVGNGYCEATKRTEIIAYPPPISGALVRTPVGTNCWPYKFKLNLANIDNTSSLEWRVEKNGGSGAANPQVGTFEIQAGVTTWEQEFEFSNATDAVATWSVIVTLHSKGDDCPIELKEDVTIGPKVKVLLENNVPIGCPDDNTGRRKVQITDKSEASPFAVRTWKIDGVPFTPTQLAADLYEVTLQNPSSTATIYPKVSLEIADGNGCIQSDELTFTLYPTVAPDFTLTYPDAHGVTQTFAPNTALCPDIDGTLTATGTGITRYEWTITNNGSTQEYHGEGSPYKFLFTNDSDADLLYTVALKGINDSKCSYTVTKEYTLHPSIKAAFTVKKIDECTPYKIQFIDQTATKLAAYNKTWNVNGGVEDPVGSGIYTYAVPGPKVITLVASSPQCNSTSAAYNFDVLPPVVATIAGIAPSTAVCAPAQLTFTNNSQNAVRNEWTFEVGTTSSVLQSGTDIKYTYTNTSDAPRTVQVLLQAYNARNCKAEDRRDLIIYPEPIPVNSFEILDKCNPFKLEFISNSGSLSDYEWKFIPVGVGAANGAQVVKTGVQNGTAVETTLTNTSLHNFIKYEITYTGKKIWSPTVTCAVGPVKVDDVTVPPKLDVTVSVKPRAGGFNQELCSGETPVSFDIQTKGGAHVHHKWDFGDGGNTETSYNEDPMEHLFENNSQEDITCNVRIRSTQEETLCTFEQNLNIVVHPEVLAVFAKKDGDICQTPREIIFTNSSRGNIGAGVTRNFIWDYGYAVGGIQQVETRNAVGVHSWHFPNDLPNTNAVRTVTLNIEEIYASGKVCRSVAPASTQVLIAPKLRPQFTVDKAIACIPFTVLLTNTSTGAPVLNYLWDYADGNTSSVSTATHTHDYNNLSLNNRYDYQVSLTIENTETRCKATVTQTVTACPKVTADFSVDNTVFCTPGSVTVHNNSKNADLYQWNVLGAVGGTVPPTTTLEDVTIPLLNPTNADKVVKLQLIASATHPNNVVCEDTKELDLTLRPEIIPDFTFAETVGCSPMRARITNQSTGARRYRWFIDGIERPDLQAQTNPEFDLVNNGVDGTPRKFKIKLIAINGDCQGEIEKEVEVYPAITAKIILSKNKGCTPLVLEATAGEQKPSYTYSWSSVQGTVDNATAVSTTATFTNSTVGPAVVVPGKIHLRVYFTAAPQCKDEAESQIDIYPAVYPEFIVPRPGCAPYDARFQLATNVFDSPETEYTWSVDGKQVLKVKEATPTDPIIRLINNDNSLTLMPEVLLHVKSAHGCEASVSHKVTVYPKPKALFQASGKSEGCPPFDVEFINQSRGVNLTYTYDFGDGASVSVSHNGPIQKQYANTTSDNVAYTVKLKTVSQFGCEDEQTSIITVYPSARADFDIVPTDKGCSPLSVRFENRSNVPTSKIFVWDFGDGTVPHEMNEPEHIFENVTVNDAVHTVTLLARTDHGCESTAAKKVTVYATPKARMKVTPMLQVYPNATVNITNTSSPAPSGWKYSWSFGDGQTSTLRDPQSHQYARWGLRANDFAYDISLKVESPRCSSETTVKAYVLPPYPDPTFTAFAYEGCVPFRLTLLRDAERLHDDETYLWDFGDGQTSTEKVPTHDYVNIGTYHVKLTVTGDGGVNYAFAVVTVLPNPKVKFTLYPDQVMLPKATIKGQNLTEGDDLSFLWNFGDGGTSSERSPIHHYMSAGKFTVKLEATNMMLADCKSSDTVSVIVRPEGHLVFPNVFQPSDNGSNGGVYDENDRANEVFHPYGEGVSDYILRIYDRWGELIFESNDIKKGWDGYINGRLCETGVYTWRAIGHFFNGEIFDLRGNVTLLRK